MKKRLAIIVFIIGILALLGGSGYMVYDLLKPTVVRDADFLVQISTWQEQDEPKVIWTFSEIGKGNLTTNQHLNDYDFEWNIDGDKLAIKTAWLYDLIDEYTFSLDQDTKTLTLTKDEETFTFVPYAETKVEDPNDDSTN